MGDLMIGLAKTVVEAALTRAQTAIDEESKLRQKSQRDLVLVTLELEMIYSFLQVANGDRLKNMMVRTWVKQVRDMAYDFQDCIEFVVHLDNRPRWWFRMLPSFMAPPRPLDEAVADLEDLKVRAEELSKYYTRYSGISDSGESAPPKILMTQQQSSSSSVADRNMGLAMLVDARGATKRMQRFGELTRLINVKEEKGLQVISVWGAGGGDHGMTSIIRRTFNHTEICKNFTYRSWVKLMHPFSPQDFIRSMMAQFYANSSKEEEKTTTVGMHVLTKMETSQAHLFKEFDRLVTEERYLVVLEGLTNMLDWDAIRTFLPDMKKGSCIIASTHQPEIATLCVGPSYQISELNKFSDDHSICALFEAAEDARGKGKKPIVIKGSQVDEVEGNRKNNIDWLVGRKSQMKELGKYPAMARANNPPVMSVWGIAGIGKTALVRNLYDAMTQSNQFEKYYWVDVSHPFNMRDLYMILLPDFHSEKDPIEACHHLLKNYRCLIVIDDIWSTKEWDLMQAALVCKHPKSVIIVITSEASVAKQCTNNEDVVFNVKALEPAAAADLFKNKVLLGNPSIIHDFEVQILILKCGGIPKVITAIAGLLSRKENTVRSLNRRFMHQLEADPKFDSLQDFFCWLHSYFRSCPDSLKPCIFYLLIFPRFNIIRRRRLIRRWIAEGYSRDSDTESAEENGETQFSQIFELSIIQQLSSQCSSSTTSRDRMVLCQVNGFIREYIVSRQVEENLVVELGDKCALATQGTGRHLVILKNWDRDRFVFEKIDFSRLRSLTVFGKWESFFISKGMKMLRVLDLEEASALNDGDLDKMVERLRRLKFLSLRGHSEIHHLPSSLKHMRQLQTLDVRGTSIVTLPKSITKLHKLQYLRAGATEVPIASSSSIRPHHFLSSVVLPRGTGKLMALHTLGVVNIGVSGAKTKLKELKKLTQLHKLGVSGINMNNRQQFGESVHGAHLESLSVQIDNDNETCLDDISMPWVNLRSLKVYGLGEKLPRSITYLSKLTKLDLEMAELMPTDIDLLAKLPELCILRLAINQPSLNFQVKIYGLEEPSYEKLRTLEIACRSSNLHVSFGTRTMRNLELLKLDCSNSSYRLSSLNYISQLKEVVLKGTNDEALKTTLQRELDSHPWRPVVKLEYYFSTYH